MCGGVLHINLVHMDWLLVQKSMVLKKCNQCKEFPCEKIMDMLNRSKKYQKKCKEVCSEEEYDALEKAFFDKESNLRK